MAITLPAILLAWHLVVERSGIRPALARTRTLWIVAAVYLAVRIGAMPLADDGPYAVRVGGFLFEHLWTYFSWAFAGFGANGGWFAHGLLTAILIAGSWLATPRARRLAGFGGLWFAIALAPVILLPEHIYRYYLVFPAIGFAVALAVALDALRCRIGSPHLRVLLAAVLVLAFAFVSRPQFERAEARRARQTERGAAIVRQLMELHPVLPDHARLYFAAPGNFALDRFLKHDGAVLRAAYRNPTLSAARLTPRVRAGLHHDADALVFVFGDDGVLRELAGGRSTATGLDYERP
jgi:hypothetical protein